MPESLFFLLTETSDMIAARTAASDFSERKRKIARKQKEIEGYEDVIFTKERELKKQKSKPRKRAVIISIRLYKRLIMPTTSHYNHKSLLRLRLQALIIFEIIFLYNAPSRNERIEVLHRCRNRASHRHQYHSTSSS